MNYHIILYHCREKYYHTMRLTAESALKHTPEDPLLRFQYCVALILEDCLGEALRELQLLSSKPDIALAALIASLYAQNICEVCTAVVPRSMIVSYHSILIFERFQVPDGEMMVTLEGRLRIERKRAGEVALYYAAVFCLQTNDYQNAREYADSIFRLNRTSAKGLHVKGWLELNEGKLTVAADCFRSVLSQVKAVRARNVRFYRNDFILIIGIRS